MFLTNSWILCSIAGVCLLGCVLYMSPRLRRRIPFAWTFRPLWTVLRGHNYVCSLEDILRGYHRAVIHFRLRTRLIQKCQLLQEELNLQLWNTPSGTFWVPRASGVSYICYALAEQYLNTYGGSRDGVRPGNVVVDCGANIGVFARQALARGARFILAFEPSPENVECLRRNLARAIVSGSVVVHEKGLWSHHCHLTLAVAPDNCGLNSFVSHIENALEQPSVEVITLDEVIAEMNLDRVDFIKMDIEGAELQALAGSCMTLTRWAPSLAVEVDHTEDPVGNAEKVIQLVRSINSSYSRRSDLWVKLRDRILYPAVILFRPA